MVCLRSLNDLGRSMHLFRLWNRGSAPELDKGRATSVAMDRMVFSDLPDGDCLVASRKQLKGPRLVQVKLQPKGELRTRKTKVAKRRKGGRNEKSFRSVLCELSPRCAVVTKAARSKELGHKLHAIALKLKQQRIRGAHVRRLVTRFKVLNKLGIKSGSTRSFCGRLRRDRLIRRFSKNSWLRLRRNVGRRDYLRRTLMNMPNSVFGLLGFIKVWQKSSAGYCSWNVIPGLVGSKPTINFKADFFYHRYHVPWMPGGSGANYVSSGRAIKVVTL